MNAPAPFTIVYNVHCHIINWPHFRTRHPAIDGAITEHSITQTDLIRHATVVSSLVADSLSTHPWLPSTACTVHVRIVESHASRCSPRNPSPHRNPRPGPASQAPQIYIGIGARMLPSRLPCSKPACRMQYKQFHRRTCWNKYRTKAFSPGIIQ